MHNERPIFKIRKAIFTDCHNPKQLLLEGVLGLNLNIGSGNINAPRVVLRFRTALLYMTNPDHAEAMMRGALADLLAAE